METDISAKVLTTEDAWSSSEVQKAQLEDPAIRPILEKKLNSEDRPSWEEIAPESPATKRYWALWDFLHLKDGFLYRTSADHEMTGFTPADMLFGRTLRLPCDILFGRSSDTPSSPNEYLNNLDSRLESVHAFSRERIKLASERMPANNRSSF
ncbi:hypothetical protein AVEN_125334-1 [Araneus ventricosus]|uniref:Uncharacterized protein n=1 Tax=Araneus ventricosus TaxID=182803 RepID=A0A4Y2IDX3_ARAVE|nr:hypothetical protein AVEN_125334-1 [Araneus ventricosus]